jgi:uncharacterized protein YuzE
MRDQTVTVEVDSLAEAAYVRFSHNDTVRTVAHNGEINIDLDEFGMVVGIEVLTLGAEMPFTALVSDYQVNSAQMKILRLICPTIPGFVARFRYQPSGDLAPTQSRELTKA